MGQAGVTEISESVVGDKRLDYDTAGCCQSHITPEKCRIMPMYEV